MSSEKQIDDYINDLEEKKEIYVQEELEYADKCHKLEEDLGFDLKKLQEAEHIYANDFENVFEKVLKKYKIIGVNFKEKKIYFWVSFCPMYLPFEDYKKTFWLKKDKSE